MALDETAKFENVQGSVKKYFVDNLYTSLGIDLMFDTDVASPDLESTNLNKWVSVVFSNMDRTAGDLKLQIFCCTRRDLEGYELGKLTDSVVGLLSNTAMSDSMARITLYKISDWTALDGGFVVLLDNESGILDGPDKTKYVVIDVTLRWSLKI